MVGMSRNSSKFARKNSPSRNEGKTTKSRGQDKPERGRGFLSHKVPSRNEAQEDPRKKKPSKKGSFGFKSNRNKYQDVKPQSKIEQSILQEVPSYLRNEILDMSVNEDNSYIITLKNSMRKSCIPGIMCLEIPNNILEGIDETIRYVIDEYEFGKADFDENIDDTVVVPRSKPNNDNKNKNQERITFI